MRSRNSPTFPSAASAADPNGTPARADSAKPKRPCFVPRAEKKPPFRSFQHGIVRYSAEFASMKRTNRVRHLVKCNSSNQLDRNFVRWFSRSCPLRVMTGSLIDMDGRETWSRRSRYSNSIPLRAATVCNFKSGNHFAHFGWIRHFPGANGPGEPIP